MALKLSVQKRASLFVPRPLSFSTPHPAPCLSHSIPAAAANDDDKDDNGVVHGPGSLSYIELAPTLQRGQPVLPLLLRRFLHAEVHSPSLYLPRFSRNPITLEHCAIAHF
ncbi:hypothetical protein B0H11DRAFT_2234501 [Mycena galericulata]|nr:hypothetical protein B0H11DRAFT_2234501 [Mycena galericulata]